MQTPTDSVPVPKIVGAAELPSEDVQDLLIRRVTDESIARMKKRITATLVFVSTVAGIIGVKGYLKVQALDRQEGVIEERQHQIDSRIRELDAALQAVNHLKEEMFAANQVQQATFAGIMSNFQQSTAGATREAYDAAARAATASQEVRTRLETVNSRVAAMEGLNDRVAVAEQRVGNASATVQRLGDHLYNTVFSNWTVVMDEGRDFREIGDSGFEGRVTHIRGGQSADLVVQDSAGTRLCGRTIRLTIGRSQQCTAGNALYRVTLVLAMKQGGIGFGFRDRAQIQLSGISSAPPQDGARNATNAVASADAPGTPR